MQLFAVNPQNPRSTDTPIPAATPNPIPEDANLNATTCVELPGAFEQLRKAVYEEFRPTSPLQRHYADELTRSLWNQTRYDTIVTQSLNIRIQEDWDAHSDTNPNPSPEYRTVKAWDSLHANSGIFRAAGCVQTAHHQSTAKIRILRDLAAHR